MRRTNELPVTCVYCSLRPCEGSLPGALDMCVYGITYYNSGEEIVRREATAPLRRISTNLRHELNPLLMLITQEASRIDPTISTRRVDLDNPASKIIGAAIIIDHVVQMITGVNEFHPAEGAESSTKRERNLADVADKYFDIYSLVRSARRADHLRLVLHCDRRIIVTHAADTVDYLLAILMDNVWKYSIPGTDVTVESSAIAEDIVDVSVTNLSRPLPEELELFSLGAQADSDSKGFGYGLFWAMVLVEQYNTSAPDNPFGLKISHRQTVIDADTAMQTFTIHNLRVRTKR